jgi:hypothetical protein
MERVSGIVTLDDKPLTRGKIQFQPDKSKGTQGPPAVGDIGPDGRYEMTTAQVKGAVFGHHTVLVEARAEPKNEMDTLPQLLTPERYTRHETSGIPKEDVKGKANEINIPLSSK